MLRILTIPLSPTEPATSPSASQSSSTERPQQAGNVGILIAVKDHATRTYYNTAMTKAGIFYVLTASTCEEALKALESADLARLNVALFDLTEEGLDGYLLLQKMRANPKYNSIEILIASDQLRDEDQFLLTELDVRNFIKKKANTIELVTKINSVLKQQVETKALRRKMNDLQTALISHNLAACEEIIGSPELAKLIESDPELVPYKGEVHLLRQETEAAIELLSNFLHGAASSGKPETFRSLAVLGKALCYANRFGEAFSVFDRLARKSPNNLSHKVGKADAMLGQGNIAGAEAEYQNVLKSDPTNADAQVGMGKAKLATGDTEAAFSIFQQINGSIESYSLASYFNNAAVALVRNGRAADAMKLYERALQFFDKFKAHIYFNMGLAKIRLGEIESACHCFDEAIKNDSTGFVDKKSILREYKEKGLSHMVARFGSRSAVSEDSSISEG